jgi:hypothetical protein
MKTFEAKLQTGNKIKTISRKPSKLLSSHYLIASLQMTGPESHRFVQVVLFGRRVHTLTTGRISQLNENSTAFNNIQYQIMKAARNLILVISAATRL